MTNFWNNWIRKIENEDVTKKELIKLFSALHDFDHEHREIIALYFYEKKESGD